MSVTTYSRAVPDPWSDPETSEHAGAEVVRLGTGSIRRRDRRAQQRVSFTSMSALWAVLHPAFNQAHVDADPVLSLLYADVATHLAVCDFTLALGMPPQVSARPARPGAPPYQVTWTPARSLGIERDAFSGTILNLLTRVAAAEMYERHGADYGELRWANVGLPAPSGPVGDGGLTPNQQDSLERQLETLDENWADLEAIEAREHRSGRIGEAEHRHLSARIQTALFSTLVHNDAVIAELLYYLQAKGLAGGRTYAFGRRMLREANGRRRRW